MYTHTHMHSYKRDAYLVRRMLLAALCSVCDVFMYVCSEPSHQPDCRPLKKRIFLPSAQPSGTPTIAPYMHPSQQPSKGPTHPSARALPAPALPYVWSAVDLSSRPSVSGTCRRCRPANLTYAPVGGRPCSQLGGRVASHGVGQVRSLSICRLASPRDSRG